jgi:hypothetical protein
MAFEYWWITNKIDNYETDFMNRTNLSIEDQIEYYTSFESNYEEITKDCKKYIKELNKPPKNYQGTQTKK